MRLRNLRVELDDYDNWKLIIWQFNVDFLSGERFEGFEAHSRRDGEHFIKMSYHFMQADGELIFRVDPHQSAVPYGTFPHLHKGPSNDCRLKDGDWRLDGYSLRDFDFPRMWELVCQYLENGSVPWRT